MSFLQDLGKLIWRDDKDKISPTRFFSFWSQVILLCEFVYAVHCGTRIDIMYWIIPAGLTANRSLIYLLDHIFGKREIK